MFTLPILPYITLHYTLHLTPYTLHLTQYALHITRYTLHLTSYHITSHQITLHHITLPPYIACFVRGQSRHGLKEHSHR